MNGVIKFMLLVPRDYYVDNSDFREFWFGFWLLLLFEGVVEPLFCILVVIVSAFVSRYVLVGAGDPVAFEAVLFVEIFKSDPIFFVALSLFQWDCVDVRSFFKKVEYWTCFWNHYFIYR